MTIKNILVPYEGSPLSKKALDLARDIARNFTADLTILMVIPVYYPINDSIFAGAAVTTKDGDALVFEMWRHAATQGSATGYAQTLYYDGTTDVTDGGTAASAASYIQSVSKLILGRQNTDSLSLSDSISLSVTKNKSLSDSVSITDSITKSTIKTKSLSDSISVTDSITKKSSTKSLSDYVSTIDSTGTSSNRIKSLSDTVSISDTRTSSATRIQSLTDNLHITDSVSTSSIKTKSLSDSLSLSDSTLTSSNRIKSLSDTVSMSDATITSASRIQSLSDSVLISDLMSISSTRIKSLSDSISLSDSESITSTKTQSLSDSILMTDFMSASSNKIKSLSDAVSLSDTSASSATRIQSLSDSVLISDLMSTSIRVTKSLSDSILMTDFVSTSSMKSKSLSDSVSAIDSTGTSSNKTQSLSDSIFASESMSESTNKTQSLSDSVSIIDSSTTSSSKLQPLTESEILTDTMLTQKSSSESFNETMRLSETVSTSTSKQILNLDTLGMTDTISLLKISSNQYLVPNNQTTVNVDPNKPNLIVTSSNATLSSITIPFTATSSTINYASIVSSGTVHILHALNITKDTNGDGHIEVVLTIPAVTDISNSAWDGILQLPTVQTSSSLILPAPQGQVGTAKTVIGVGSSLSLTFNNATRISFIGQNGTHVGFFSSPTSVTEVTQTCTSDNQSVANTLPAGGICKINVGGNLVIWTKHFTGFATWTLSSIPPTPPSPQIPSASGGGYGTGAATPVATGITSAAGMLPTGVTLYDVTYDICDQQKVQFTVGSSDSTTPTVEFATPSGVVTAKISDHQPYAGLHDLTQKYVLSYDAPLKPGTKTFNMLVTPGTGTGYVTAKVDVTKCKQTVTFAPIPIIGASSPDAPKIFDIKLQMDNGTRISAAEIDDQYITNQNVTISGLVYSQVPLDHAEIRVAKIGENTTIGYAQVMATVTPISVSNTYLVSATLPPNYLVSPAITYWVYAKNIEGFEIESDQYSIGVSPSYDASGTIGFVTPQNVPAGLTQSPQVYFTNNSTGVLYGTVSLIVDGKQMSQFADHLFDRGTSVMELDWAVPSTDNTTEHSVQAVATFYGHTFASDKAEINSYVYKKITPLANLQPIQSFVDKQGNVIANARSLYSSFVTNNGTLFHVVSPSGVCVVGESSTCLVNESTLTANERYSVVTLDGANYTVYYSDIHSPLQRFSITSLQPITGDWKITLENNGIEQKDLENAVRVNVKYVAEDKQLLISLP